MEKNIIKYKSFRRKQKWNQIAEEVCNWINSEITVARIVSISSVLCHSDNAGLVNLYYNDVGMEGDIFEQASKSVLRFKILQQKRTMLHSWKVHNEAIISDINKISEKGNIVAINNLECDQTHQYNLTIVWYSKSK